jgi:hypothetical protein
MKDYPTLRGWPPHIEKKFIKAVLKIRHPLLKQGISVTPYMYRCFPIFEMGCEENPDLFAALVIYYYEDDNTYQVFEYQGGPEKELWIYGYFKSPMAALKKFIKSDSTKKPMG